VGLSSHKLKKMKKANEIMELKRVTIQDVADEAQVSVTSVSLYLNEKPGLSEVTRERIAKAVEKLGYVPRRQTGNGVDPSLIGLLVERLPFSMFSELHYGEVLHGMEAQAREFGYHLSLIVVEPEESLEHMVERIREVAGVVILGAGDITKTVIQTIITEERAVLLVDVNAPELIVNSVLVDNVGGGYEATRHLFAKGYQHIACIQGPSKYPSLVERFQGYCFAHIEAGKNLNPKLIQPSISKGFPNKGYREMKDLLERGEPFDAVFCVSDRAALGALQALQEAKVRVPNEVALVGFEDVPQVGHTTPPLTTVKMPKSLMGRVAIQRLHDLITRKNTKEPVKTVLYTTLVVREST
jgi:DNA-binding LacI/PurR family transcriptional regulator